MSAPETPHRQTPTERSHELLLAAMTRPQRSGQESVTFKQAQVGDLKGQWVCDGLTVYRNEDERVLDWIGRSHAMVEDIDGRLRLTNASHAALTAGTPEPRDQLEGQLRATLADEITPRRRSRKPKDAS